MTKIDLNAPAFGQGAQKVSDLVSEDTTEVTPAAEQASAEAVAEVKPEVAATGETSEEESTVPYRRFKKFHDAAKEAREEADYWRQQAESLKSSQYEAPAPTNADDDLPREWVKLYGDNDASKDAWQVQKQLNARILEQARQEAIESLRSEQYQEQERTEQNLDKLDDGFEQLSDLVGHELTDGEQSAILDIIDDYTPKDRNGNYLGEILPFEKAWEIYELKQAASKAPKAAARNNVASLSGNVSRGETQVATEEQNKNWNPLDWNAYKKRI